MEDMAFKRHGVKDIMDYKESKKSELEVLGGPGTCSHHVTPSRM